MSFQPHRPPGTTNTTKHQAFTSLGRFAGTLLHEIVVFLQKTHKANSSTEFGSFTGLNTRNPQELSCATKPRKVAKLATSSMRWNLKGPACRPLTHKSQLQRPTTKCLRPQAQVPVDMSYRTRRVLGGWARGLGRAGAGHICWHN